MATIQKLASYYRDVLTVLAENQGRALRNLRIGRGYGLVADLSVYGKSLRDLIEEPHLTLEKITPDPGEEIFFDQEPEIPFEVPQKPPLTPQSAAKLSESQALIRIWRKQKQDPYNRETLLGVGLVHASISQKGNCLGPVFCYRVRPDYLAADRKYRIEKVSETPFPNLTLLAQLLTDEERSEIRLELHKILLDEFAGEKVIERIFKVLSSTATLLQDLKYTAGRLQTLSQLTGLQGNDLPVLACGAVLLNIPRGNAYLRDDLDALARRMEGSEIQQTAVRPFLEVPSDHPHEDFPARRTAFDGPLLFPLGSNKEQRDVARLASTKQVLVVHGPPGTGKSQTICNLVCHLVASGKTVLVTSQKDKALEVVRDKLPQVDYLAMDLLRTDSESQKTLLQRLDFYQAAIGGASFVELERKTKEIPRIIAENTRIQSELRSRFSYLRRLEHTYFPLSRHVWELRNQSKNRHEGSWFRRAFIKFASHYASLRMQKVCSKHPDDTNIISSRLRELKRKNTELVIALLAAQRRLQLLRASQNKATAFAIEKLKKLLKRKKKTPQLETLKTQIEFPRLLEVFPCWIVSIDDAARIFPLSPGLFDYLIVDEASQCNQATALHLAYRAKRLIVVGDEKQLPNADVQWLKAETIEQLLMRHGLSAHPKKDFFSAHESLLSLALGSRDAEVHLSEHFRCDPKIIEWSNREFYAGSLRILTPVRYPRFRPPIEVHYVPDAYEDSDSGVNIKEAEAVIEEIDRILADPKLEGLSLGVISPFRPQADLIYALMQERFADRWRECERRGLTASTADGFQGDERDVILYSMRHAPGSHPGSITGIEANQGARRLNVAFTRARRKVIIFCSLPGDRFPGKYISSFLKHAITVQASYRDPLITALEEDHFDSEFEREVCQRLRAQGLRVTTQFPVAGYRIDLVVEDNEGRRLGVECDGPFHYDELGHLRDR